MTFNSNDSDNSESTSNKKSINDITGEFYTFWIPFFKDENISSPIFRGKICYNAKEFTPKEPAIRFFKSELSCGDDLYLELCDWDFNFYEPMFRKLYRLKYNPNWETELDKYVPSNNTASPTVAVRVTDLELVNETSITKTAPEITNQADSMVQEDEESAMADVFGELEDDHISKMTIRDEYCIKQNVPMSNKPWLNTLIKKGLEWQKRKQ